MSKITVIPATVNLHTHKAQSFKKRKVAGYARVSTDSDEQATSYVAQVDYYTNYIRSKPDWELVDIYTDDGISATNTKHRVGFNNMIKDALDGKIDLIVTKSVSRFARNTVDSLTTIRKLKEHGVECYFEKENIHTFDSKGELLITIMSSLAQEESRSISENCTWGHRKRFADGRFSMPYEIFLGYRKGADGKPEVVPEEAATVRLIYRLFLEGATTLTIAKHLEEKGLPSPTGNKRWHATSVESILRNEKYKGDALLQKTFTVDFLQKKVKINEGEVPQYYVENSHDFIIPPEEWELVQEEFKRRKGLAKTYSSRSIFSSKLFCEDCGGVYGSKVWHSTDKYRKIVWRCNNKYKKKPYCSTPSLSGDKIKAMFLNAYNSLTDKADELIENCELMRPSEDVMNEYRERIERLRREAEELSGYITSLGQAPNNDSMDSIVSMYEECTAELQSCEEEHKRLLIQDCKISEFTDSLKAHPAFLDEWDDSLWSVTIEHATVHRDGSITFLFRNGAEIRIEA